MLELLPNQNSFTRHLKDFLDKCIVEGKSPATLRIYDKWISEYLNFIYPETPNKSNTLSYLASLKNRRYSTTVKKDNPYSASTLHQAFRSLRTWFNWLASEEE